MVLLFDHWKTVFPCSKHAPGHSHMQSINATNTAPTPSNLMDLQSNALVNLKTMANLGLILCPDGSHQLNAYSNSNFAGNRTAKYAHPRKSQLSRAGCVITYSDCPIYWFSKLEMEIALSTCKAEYIARSICCHQLIPLCRILDELYSIFQVLLDTSHREMIKGLTRLQIK